MFVGCVTWSEEAVRVGDKMVFLLSQSSRWPRCDLSVGGGAWSVVSGEFSGRTRQPCSFNFEEQSKSVEERDRSLRPATMIRWAKRKSSTSGRTSGLGGGGGGEGGGGGGGGGRCDAMRGPCCSTCTRVVRHSLREDHLT